MSISSFFSTSCETKELHSDALLRTRYYRNSFKQCLEAIEKMTETSGFEIRNVNQQHGEIYIISNGFDCIFTISQISPIESGIDMKINFFSFAGFNRPKKKAIQFYEQFNKALKFKGVSLHP